MSTRKSYAISSFFVERITPKLLPGQTLSQWVTSAISEKIARQEKWFSAIVNNGVKDNGNK